MIVQIHSFSMRVMMIAKLRNEMLGATKRFYRYNTHDILF